MGLLNTNPGAICHLNGPGLLADKVVGWESCVLGSKSIDPIWLGEIRGALVVLEHVGELIAGVASQLSPDRMVAHWSTLIDLSVDSGSDLWSAIPSKVRIFRTGKPTYVPPNAFPLAYLN
jgi:hypothetical protein